MHFKKQELRNYFCMWPIVILLNIMSMMLSHIEEAFKCFTRLTKRCKGILMTILSNTDPFSHKTSALTCKILVFKNELGPRTKIHECSRSFVFDISRKTPYYASNLIFEYMFNVRSRLRCSLTFQV